MKKRQFYNESLKYKTLLMETIILKKQIILSIAFFEKAKRGIRRRANLFRGSTAALNASNRILFFIFFNRTLFCLKCSRQIWYNTVEICLSINLSYVRRHAFADLSNVAAIRRSAGVL